MMTYLNRFSIRSANGLPLLLGTLLFLLVPTAELSADSFDVGGTDIEVPAPGGFVMVTEVMEAVDRLAAQMADPMNDQLAYYVIAASMAMVNASGKVLFLYAYAPEDELELTRKTSAAWANAVLAANGAPQKSSTVAPGSRASNGGGFDWKRVLKMAIIGGIIGGVVGGIGALKKRWGGNS